MQINFLRHSTVSCGDSSKSLTIKAVPGNSVWGFSALPQDTLIQIWGWGVWGTAYNHTLNNVTHDLHIHLKWMYLNSKVWKYINIFHLSVNNNYNLICSDLQMSKGLPEAWRQCMMSTDLLVCCPLAAAELVRRACLQPLLLFSPSYPLAWIYPPTATSNMYASPPRSLLRGLEPNPVRASTSATQLQGKDNTLFNSPPPQTKLPKFVKSSPVAPEPQK